MVSEDNLVVHTGNKQCRVGATGWHSLSDDHGSCNHHPENKGSTCSPPHPCKAYLQKPSRRLKCLLPHSRPCSSVVWLLSSSSSLVFFPLAFDDYQTQHQMGGEARRSRGSLQYCWPRDQSGGGAVHTTCLATLPPIPVIKHIISALRSTPNNASPPDLRLFQMSLSQMVGQWLICLWGTIQFSNSRRWCAGDATWMLASDAHKTVRAAKHILL